MYMKSSENKQVGLAEAIFDESKDDMSLFLFKF